MSLTVGSLFSGIGGLDLGLERAGMEVIWQSEIDPYGCRVLKKHWPEVVNHGNIKDINWRDVVRPDVICGGYPCQPFSMAGKRQGTDDPRHLWPWVRDAISELRPRYAILENVRGHITLGLSTVLGELAAIGYDAEWQIVSAASVGAPHRRDRVVILAYPSEQFKHGRGHLNSQSASGQWQAIQEPSDRSDSPSTDTVGELANPGDGGCLHRQPRIYSEESHASREWWTTEPDVGRVAHGIPSRVDRLRGLGNAVVPQVAELVGRMVVDYEATR